MPGSMASELEPPTLPIAAAAAAGPGTLSNRTSITRISMDESGNDAGGSGLGDDATSHELAPQSVLTTKTSSPGDYFTISCRTKRHSVLPLSPRASGIGGVGNTA